MREITTHRIEGKTLADHVRVLAGANLSAGGAPVLYEIFVGLTHEQEPGEGPKPYGQKAVVLSFQEGNPNVTGVNGLCDEALLVVLLDRLRSFQAGPFPCDENARALHHLELGLEQLQNRTKARLARSVEGQAVR